MLTAFVSALGASANRSPAQSGALNPLAQPTNSSTLTAFVAASETHFSEEKAAQLQRLGFSPQRVAPVILSEAEHERRGCRLTAKKAGVFEAHVNMWRRVANQTQRALLLEEDWSIGGRDEEASVAAQLRTIESRTEDYMLIGHCYTSSCATAYYLTPKAARGLTRIDSCNVGDCPVDWFLESLTRLGLISSWISLPQASFGRNENGAFDGTQDGIFQQDEHQFVTRATRLQTVEAYTNCRCAMAAIESDAATMDC